MEQIYNDYELNLSANRIKDNVDEIAESMSFMIGGNQQSNSSKSEAIFKKIGETPIDFAKNFYRSNINDLRFIKSKVGSFDDIYKELSDGVVMTLVGIIKFPVTFARMMTMASDIKSSKSSPEVQQVRNNLTEGAKLLSEIAQMDISIEVKTAINSLQNEIKSIEKKLDPSSGCFIATCVYEDYNHSNVITLRIFRDLYLSKNLVGRLIIRIYYSISPLLIFLFNITWVKSLSKYILSQFVNHINKSYYAKQQ